MKRPTKRQAIQYQPADQTLRVPVSELDRFPKVYKIKDRVLYFSNGNLIDGQVVMILDVPGFAYPHYLVQTETEIEPILVVRSGFFPELRPVPKKGLH